MRTNSKQKNFKLNIKSRKKIDKTQILMVSILCVFIISIILLIFINRLPSSNSTETINIEEEFKLAEQNFKEKKYDQSILHYTNIINNAKTQKEIDMAYQGQVQIYTDTYNSKEINKIADDIKEKLDSPSNDLIEMINKEKDKKWYLIETQVYLANSDTTDNIYYKYDTKGRVIESTTLPFKTDHGVMFYDGYSTYLTYADDDSIFVREYTTTGKLSGGVTRYKIDEDGFITEYQKYDPSTMKPDGSTVKYNMEFKTNSIISEGSYTQYYDDHHNLYKVVKEIFEPQETDRYDYKYDDYGNMLSAHKFSYEKYICSNYHKYVYCNPNELNGDLSKYPISDGINLN